MPDAGIGFCGDWKMININTQMEGLLKALERAKKKGDADRISKIEAEIGRCGAKHFRRSRR